MTTFGNLADTLIGVGEAFSGQPIKIKLVHVATLVVA